MKKILDILNDHHDDELYDLSSLELKLITNVFIDQMRMRQHKKSKASTELQQEFLKRPCLDEGVLKGPLFPNDLYSPYPETKNEGVQTNIEMRNKTIQTCIDIKNESVQAYIESKNEIIQTCIETKNQDSQTDVVIERTINQKQRKKSNSNKNNQPSVKLKLSYTDRTRNEISPLFISKSVEQIYIDLKGRIPLRTLYAWKARRNENGTISNKKGGGQRTKLYPVEQVLFEWFLWKRAEGQIMEDRILHNKMLRLCNSLAVSILNISHYLILL